LKIEEVMQQWLSLDEAERLFPRETWDHYGRKNRVCAFTKLYNISACVKLFLSPPGIYSPSPLNKRRRRKCLDIWEKIGYITP
jgi:hypothetical protein